MKSASKLPLICSLIMSSVKLVQAFVPRLRRLAKLLVPLVTRSSLHAASPSFSNPQLMRSGVALLSRLKLDVAGSNDRLRTYISGERGMYKAYSISLLIENAI